MPTPKFLRKFSSKGPSKDSPDDSPEATMLTPPETPAIADQDVPQYSDAMKEAWRAANVELPQARGVEKFLNSVGTLTVSSPQHPCTDVHEEKVQDAVTLSVGEQAVVNTLATPAMALVDAPQMADAIEKGVNAFMETVPVLMKALDEVAKVHPFISGMGESVLGMRVLIND